MVEEVDVEKMNVDEVDLDVDKTGVVGVDAVGPGAAEEDVMGACSVKEAVVVVQSAPPLLVANAPSGALVGTGVVELLISEATVPVIVGIGSVVAGGAYSRTGSCSMMASGRPRVLSS